VGVMISRWMRWARRHSWSVGNGRGREIMSLDGSLS